MFHTHILVYMQFIDTGSSVMLSLYNIDFQETTLTIGKCEAETELVKMEGILNYSVRLSVVNRLSVI